MRKPPLLLLAALLPIWSHAEIPADRAEQGEEDKGGGDDRGEGSRRDHRPHQPADDQAHEGGDEEAAADRGAVLFGEPDEHCGVGAGGVHRRPHLPPVRVGRPPPQHTEAAGEAESAEAAA